MGVEVIIPPSGGSLPDMETIMAGAQVTPKTIVADRVLSSDPEYNKATEEEKKNKRDEVAGKIKDDSPAVKSVKHEIRAANSLIKAITSNIPLLSNPFSGPGAVMAIISVLGDLILILDNLGLLDKLPPEFLNTLRGITTTISTLNILIKTANTVLGFIPGNSETDPETGESKLIIGLPEVPVPEIRIT